MSYATDVELVVYATARGVTLTADPLVLLTKANDWLETLLFKGVAIGATAFPRDDLYVNSVLVPNDSIPDNVKQAEMRMAIEIDKGNDPLATLTKDAFAVREKVDVIDVEYGRGSESPVIRSVLPLLKNYLLSAGGLTVVAAN